MKITEKGLFNIASEASYVYILSGQKFILKMPKMVNLDEFLKTWSLRSNSVTRQVNFNRTKISKKCQNSKIQIQHFGWVSNTVLKGYNLKKSWKFVYIMPFSPLKSEDFVCLFFSIFLLWDLVWENDVYNIAALLGSWI